MTSALPPALSMNVRFTAEFWQGAKRAMSPQRKIDRITRRDEDWLQFQLDNGDALMKRETELDIRPHVNERCYVETVQGILVTGLFLADKGWAFRLDAEQIAQQVRSTAELNYQRRVNDLAENREGFEIREAALPDWIKARVEHFRALGKESFELNGWRYELAICELAAALDGGATQEQFVDLAERLAASANQVQCAAALVACRAKHGDEAIHSVPAGMAPVNGKLDYT